MLPQLTSLPDQLRPDHTALVVVDVQKDYCADDGLLATRSGQDMAMIREAMPRLNTLIEGARDHHVPVVWIRAGTSMQTLQPNHLAVRGDGNGLLSVEGSAGAEFDERVVPPLPSETVVTKRNYDGFYETALNTVLRAKGIRTLVMAGFTTNVCVESTARHGHFMGYYIVLASDCAGAPDPLEHESAVRNITRYFGKVASGAEIASLWASAPSRGHPTYELSPQS
jgi:nicotinamidase-related amidase